MSDESPLTSQPGHDEPPSRPPRRSWWWVWVAIIVLGTALVSLVANTPVVATFFAFLLGAAIFRVGLFFLQSFATPPPPPPDPGQLRKVKLHYRCEICGTEVRMVSAVTEDPEPPRHCMEDMELVSATE